MLKKSNIAVGWPGITAAGAALLFLFAGPAPTAGGATPRTQTHWIGTWAAAPVHAENIKDKVAATGQTYRQLVRISVGGDRVRINVSNEFGTQPLHIDSASIGVAAANSSRIASSVPVTFGGARSVIIPPGALVLSDGVALKAPSLSMLAIDLYLPQQPITELTCHPEALQTSYSAPDNQTGAETLQSAHPYTRWYFLKGVDVDAPLQSAAIVTLGDSIIDGHKSTLDANARWPDVLAERLQKDPATRGLSVLNEGIGGNRLLRDLGGAAALARFDRDVLGQAGVRYLIVSEGLNDIGHVERPAFPGDTVTASDLTFALSQLIERAHSHGILVFGATLTPYPGTGAAAPQMVALEQAENDWIRKDGEFDGVIDFYNITRDPAHPDAMLPAYDSGDHLHPGDNGYKAMAAGIDLRLFKR